MHPLLQPELRLVIGHRGNAAHAPENTMPSIEQAIALGADAVEIDVHVTADGEVVVIHDPTLERTTGGRGAVAQLTLAELRRYDAGATFTPDRGATFPWRDRGIVVPTLRDVLHSFAETPFVIELKTPLAQERVMRIVRDQGAAGRVVLASFDYRALLEPRRAGLFTGASRPELLSMFTRSVLRLAPGRFAFSAVFLPRRYGGMRLPPHPVLRAAAPGQIPVHTWVENDPLAATMLWRAGVSGVVTDDPGRLLQARSEAP
jgi:glycerophosphoryl diester phosphodiesterase